MHAKTTSFCYDFVGKHPRIALVFSSPTTSDCVEQTPLSGAQGWWFLKHFAEPYGLVKDNFIISHTLRCRLPYSYRLKGDDYPTGHNRVQAENNCRHYDNTSAVRGETKPTGLLDFSPNIALITLDPKDVHKVSAYHRQIAIDMGKAVEFVKQGYRPVVLFGNEAGALIFSFIEGQGGAKANRGHFSEIAGWPFSGVQEISKGFK